MLVYYLLLLWFCISALIFSPFESHLRRGLEFSMCLIPALLIMMMRGVSVGTDTAQYVGAVDTLKAMDYQQYVNQGLYSYYENGFTYLLRFCTLFPDPGRILILISSVIIVVLPFYAIYRLCIHPALMYVIYFLTTQYYMGLSAMRQCIAIAFVYIAILVYYTRRRMVLSLLFVLLASCFHLTILIVVPILVIPAIRIGKKILYWLAALVAVILAFGNRFVSLFSVISKYSGYLSSGTDFLTAGKLMPLLQILYFATMLIYFLHFQKLKMKFTLFDKVSQDSIVLSKAVYACIFGVCIGCAALYINVFYRFMYNVMPFIMFGISWSFTYQKRKETSQMMYILMILVTIVFFAAFLFVPESWFGIVDYTTYSNI